MGGESEHHGGAGIRSGFSGPLPKAVAIPGEADRKPSTHRNRPLMGGKMVVKWWLHGRKMVVKWWLHGS